MATGTLVSVDEYLHTSYSPDVDFVEGVLQERNVGEKDHGRLQILLGRYLVDQEETLGIRAFTEQRIQISPFKFRIPDICVVVGPEPDEQVFTVPPFLCIEILSPEDRMGRMEERIEDYLSMGVRFVWLVDPASRKAWIYTRDARVEVKDGLLKTDEPAIHVRLDNVFRR